MVVIVVALDDCTISVTRAPQNAPDSGVAAALLSIVRNPGPAIALRPAVTTLMPSRNSPTPPRTEIAVAMRLPAGASTIRAARYVSSPDAERIIHHAGIVRSTAPSTEDGGFCRLNGPRSFQVEALDVGRVHVLANRE